MQESIAFEWQNKGSEIKEHTLLLKNTKSKTTKKRE